MYTLKQKTKYQTDWDSQSYYYIYDQYSKFNIKYLLKVTPANAIILELHLLHLRWELTPNYNIQLRYRSQQIASNLLEITVKMYTLA